MTNRLKADAYRRLAEEAAGCEFCPNMAGQRAVLGSQNGTLDAEVLFLAEAPGRFGAGRTGIPFSGDRSGHNFETLLEHAGFNRKDVFITNAALCLPLKGENNRRPTAREIDNCSYYLRSVLDIIDPSLVVTLGTVALSAVNRLLGTRFQLSEQLAQPIATKDFTLFPLYHPSPRVTNWKRPLPLQKRDFKKIRRLINSYRKAS